MSPADPIIIPIQKLHPNAKMPVRATKGSSGYDLCSTEFHILGPGHRVLVGTGLAMAIPLGLEVQIRPRSGLAFRYGVTVLNAPGTVDSDYRGEVKVLLINHGSEEFRVYEGDRIAQAVIATVWDADPMFHPARLELGTFAASLDGTDRGAGGFGSTGA